jgi:hypothetical protein
MYRGRGRCLDAPHGRHARGARQPLSPNGVRSASFVRHSKGKRARLPRSNAAVARTQSAQAHAARCRAAAAAKRQERSDTAETAGTDGHERHAAADVRTYAVQWRRTLWPQHKPLSKSDNQTSSTPFTRTRPALLCGGATSLCRRRNVPAHTGPGPGMNRLVGTTVRRVGKGQRPPAQHLLPRMPARTVVIRCARVCARTCWGGGWVGARAPTLRRPPPWHPLIVGFSTATAAAAG